MRRIHFTTWALLSLLAGLVATLVALAVRRSAGGGPPISHQVNDLVATFEIPLQGTSGSVHAIPGWVTLGLLTAAAVWAGARLVGQRARSKRS